MYESIILKITYDTDEAVKEGIIHVVGECCGGIREIEELKGKPETVRTRASKKYLTDELEGATETLNVLSNSLKDCTENGRSPVSSATERRDMDPFADFPKYDMYSTFGYYPKARIDEWRSKYETKIRDNVELLEIYKRTYSRIVEYAMELEDKLKAVESHLKDAPTVRPVSANRWFGVLGKILEDEE